MTWGKEYTKVFASQVPATTPEAEAAVEELREQREASTEAQTEQVPDKCVQRALQRFDAIVDHAYERVPYQHGDEERPRWLWNYVDRVLAMLERNDW